MRWEYRTVDWGEIRKIGSRITGEDFIDANVDAGLNFSLYCSGPRREGHRLGWTSDSLQFHSEVIL